MNTEVKPKAVPLTDAELAALDLAPLSAAAIICCNMRDNGQPIVKADTRDWAKHFSLAEAIANALPGLLARLEAAEAAKWVPVSERRPMINQEVLALLSSGSQVVVGFEGSCWVTGFGTEYPMRGNSKQYTVTHWQPLPAAPANG